MFNDILMMFDEGSSMLIYVIAPSVLIFINGFPGSKCVNVILWRLLQVSLGNLFFGRSSKPFMNGSYSLVFVFCFSLST